MRASTVHLFRKVSDCALVIRAATSAAHSADIFSDNTARDRFPLAIDAPRFGSSAASPRSAGENRSRPHRSSSARLPKDALRLAAISAGGIPIRTWATFSAALIVAIPRTPCPSGTVHRLESRFDFRLIDESVAVGIDLVEVCLEPLGGLLLAEFPVAIAIGTLKFGQDGLRRGAALAVAATFALFG